MTVQIEAKSSHVIAAVMNFGQFTKDCDEHYSTTFTASDTAVIVFPYRSDNDDLTGSGVFREVIEASLRDSFEHGWNFRPDDAPLPFHTGSPTP